MLILYSALIFTYFLSVFIDWIGLDYIVGILAILSLIFSFKDAKRLYKITSLIFLMVGLSLYTTTGRSWHEIPLLMTSTVIILAIFYVLPFINSIIVVGRYDRSVNKLLKMKVNHLGQLYYRGSIVSYLLGAFLNISTLPLVQNVLHKNLRSQTKRLRNVFTSQAMLRGYALCLVWSPMEIMVAMSVDVTGTSYLRILPWLIFFSILLLFIDWLFGWRYKKYTIDSNKLTNDVSVLDVTVFRKIIMLVVYLLLFILSITSLKSLTGLNFLTAVALIIIPYSFIWALTINRWRSFLNYSIQTWKVRTSALQNYMVLFIAVSLFISVLNESGLMSIVQQPLATLAEQPIYLFISIQLIFLLLAMIGFHPLVTISILGELIKPLILTVSPTSLAIVLITSSLSTVMAGPYNISVSLTSVLVEENPYRISLWNIGYALLFSSIGTLIGLFLL